MDPRFASRRKKPEAHCSREGRKAGEQMRQQTAGQLPRCEGGQLWEPFQKPGFLEKPGFFS